MFDVSSHRSNPVPIRRPPTTPPIRTLFIVLGALCGALGLFLQAAPADAQDPATGRVQLTLQEIRVPGGGEVERAIRRLVPLRLGDQVDEATLSEIRESLSANPALDEVQVYTARGDVPGAVVLYIEAEFDRGFHFETGLGRTLFRGWYLNLAGLRYSSPFHRGGLIRISFRSYVRTNGVYVEAEYPRLVGDEHDLLFDVSTETDSWRVIESPGADTRLFQEILRNRFHAGVRRWIDSETSATAWLGYSDAKPDDKLFDSFSNEDRPVDGTYVPVPMNVERFIDARLEASRDRWDAVSPWQKGHWAGLKLNGSVQIDGAPYTGLELAVARAIPLEGAGAFAFRGRAAYAGGGTPYHLRLIAGGNESLRGWPLAGLSGPLGTRALWQLNTELRLPVLGREKPWPRVIQTVFLDVGDHWAGDGERFGLSASVGFGLLVRLPWIQVLNTEVAFPVTGDTSNNPVTVDLSLGRSF